MKLLQSYLRAFTLTMLDMLEAMGVLLSLLFLKPAKLVLQTLRVSDWFGFAFYTLPRGFLATYIRGRVEHSLGHYEKASSLQTYLANQIEKDLKGQGQQKRRLAVDALTRVYCALFRAQVNAGRIESAASTLIRASKSIGLDRLPDIHDFDTRTAHIVKAGIAASRLLDEGGLATLMVKQGENPVVAKGKSPFSAEPPAKKLTRPSPAPKLRPLPDGAKIIPFPTLH
jgi:hypothetical protein